MALRRYFQSNAPTGHYHLSAQTGLTTGLGAAAVVFSARWATPNYQALLLSLDIQAAVITPFGAAQEVGASAYVARAFTAAASGGTAITLTGNNQKASTVGDGSSVADMRVAAAAAITAGTRTLDANPWTALLMQQGNSAAPTNFVWGDKEWEAFGDQSFGQVFGYQEGFQILVPIAQGATGTVRYSFAMDWLEFQIDGSVPGAGP